MSSYDIILAILYGLALVYCFLGLSAITASFFHGMENIVLQTREVSFQDPDTGRQVVKRQRIWNYAVADITLLAFGTSFPQISLATIDAFINLGNLYAGDVVDQTLTNVLGDITGISSFVIALTVLATGASWPDLAASVIAAYRQSTADSAIANITCSNSVNIFIGIGVPWVINTVYNKIVLHDVLLVPASDLSFILVVYFITFVFCVVVLVARRYFIGGELGGPRKWAWASSIFILLLWMVFLVLSCLRVYDIL